MQSDASAQTASFHEVEIWRTRLMTEGKDALTAFVEEYKPADVQSLRQLIKKAGVEHAAERNLGGSKALFRFLRSIIQ